MKILITGGTGLLGKALIEESGGQNEIWATYLGNYEMPDSAPVKYRKLDILDQAGQLQLISDFRPDVVVHAASIGSPDYAEKNRQMTWDVNVGGTKGLLSICEKFGVKFIYISSNGIYDGDRAPYGELDAAQPINFYGHTKLEGEKIAQAAKVAHAIVRPILMYGWNHKFERANIVTLALSKLKAEENVFAYDDVYSNALYVNSCAQAILKIIQSGRYETFNIGGAQRASIYELLCEAAGVFGLDRSKIKPVQQGYFNELVPRPKDTSYRVEKMENELGIRPLTLREGLKKMRQDQK